MAQPQGLNVPVILTTGVVGVILTMAIIEGVRAYYNYYSYYESARKWELATLRTADALKHEQLTSLQRQEPGRLPIDKAMALVARTDGKLPTTRPAAAGATTGPTTNPAPTH